MRRLAVVLVVLLAGSSFLPVVAGAPADVAGGAQEAAAVDGDDTVRLTQRYARLPDRPGEVQVTLQFEIPDRVGRLTTGVPADATVTATDGFRRVNATQYEWAGDATPASVTYRLPVNDTREVTGPGFAPADASGPTFASADESGPDVAPSDAAPPASGPTPSHFQHESQTGYLFADVGEWALFSRPPTQVNWGYRGSEVGFSRTQTVAGPGVAGDTLVYLGEVREHTRAVEGQRVRLVVPETATLRERPAQVLDAMEYASGTLRVGDRDDEVLAIAAPTGRVEWAVRGLQTGPADFWVAADERLNRTNSAWFHEYVHTRTDYRASRGTRWFGEGGATYYATLLALSDQRISFAEFRDYLDVGRRTYGDAVLADPSRWRANGNYFKGALVTGELDRRIRLASDGSATFQTVFRRFNAHDGRVNQSDLLSLVESAGDADVRERATTYTETDRSPAAWSEAEHAEAFGPVPARLVTGFAADPIRVAGPYRNRTLSGSTPTVVPGERVTALGRIANVGGTATDYEATVTLDGDPLASRSGTLEPNASETVEASHVFDRPGSHEFGSGAETLEVRVVDPATPTVGDVTANRTGPETFAVAATVRNDADRPGGTTLTVTRDGEVVGTREVRLGPGAERRVTTPVSVPGPGTYTLGVADAGERTVTVATTTATTATTASGTDETATPTAGPGFGALPALVALLATAAALRARS